MTSVKFADPSNPSVVWDRMIEPMPEWIRAHLASGQFLNDWLVKEETAPIDLKPLRNSDTSVKPLRNSEQFKQTDWASDNCPVCMNPLPRNATGRPPVHCSNACKQSAYRLRNSLRNQSDNKKALRNLSPVFDAQGQAVLSGSAAEKAHYITSAFYPNSETFSHD